MDELFFNIQTGAPAEILSSDEATVTFRSLPVGKPNTIPREKFEKAFCRQVVLKPESQPVQPKEFNRLGLQAVTPAPELPPKVRAYRDRRAYYQQNRERLKAKSLAYYYFRKLRVRCLPLSDAEKNRIEEEHEKKKAYQRVWWHKRKDRIQSSTQKADNSGQEVPVLDTAAGVSGGSEAN